MFEKPRPWWHGAHLTRIALGLLFLYSGAVKIADLPTFHRDVLGYQIVFGPAAGWITVLVPVIELLVALCLLMRRLVCGSLVAVMGMMGVFIFSIAYAMHRGLDIRCGCFGPMLDKMTGSVSIGINVVLFLAALWLLLDEIRSKPDDRPRYTFSRELLRKK